MHYGACGNAYICLVYEAGRYPQQSVEKGVVALWKKLHRAGVRRWTIKDIIQMRGKVGSVASCVQFWQLHNFDPIIESTSHWALWVDATQL
jgi:hypothetical protein